MFKYWAKNRLIFDVLSCILSSLLFCFAFSLASYKDYSAIYLQNSVYCNTQIDYQVPNPSTKQLKEIKEMDFVEDIFGYYYTKTNVTNNKTIKTNLLLSDTMDSVEFTMFGQNNMKKSISVDKPSALIDEKVSKLLNVNVGDEIKVNLASNVLDYIVSGIYESTTLYSEGVVLVDFSDEAKQIYESKTSSNSYAGAFIEATDEEKCKEYLDSYIPLGRLKDRSEFESDEAYELYNNSILSENYKNEISNFCNQRSICINAVEEEKSHLFIMMYIGALVSGIVFLLITELLRFRKSENIYFSEIIKNKKTISSYRWLSFLTCIISYNLFIFLLSIFVLDIKFVLLPSLLTSLCLLLICALNLIQDRAYLKK